MGDSTVEHLRALLSSQGAAGADAATVEALREIAQAQYTAVLGTASRLSARAGAASISAEAALAAADIHMLHQQPQRERMLDLSRFTNGRIVAWPLSSEVLVPGDAPPPAADAPGWLAIAGAGAAVAAAPAASAASNSAASAAAAAAAAAAVAGHVAPMRLPPRAAEAPRVVPAGASMAEDA